MDESPALPGNSLDEYGRILLESPALAAMIVDREMTIRWHNAAYARDMAAGPDLVGRKCYEVARDAKRHAGCPTQLSLHEGRTTRGLYDFGARNALVATIPLPDGLALKIHAFLPKEPDGETEVF